jgi:polygalacturonase
VYDVVKDFGAVGDGVADDTDAIKTAWDTACADDGDGVVLARAGYSFLVHTTVFTGPCQGSVTIQVRTSSSTVPGRLGRNAHFAWTCW